jgi:hypothetical protein
MLYGRQMLPTIPASDLARPTDAETDAFVAQYATAPAHIFAAHNSIFVDLP